jgi:prevent-host-death family protein
MSVERAETLSVAEAKARFSELIDRVRRGERFIVARRGKPVVALVAPGDVPEESHRPLGLAAGAGALADWEGLPKIVEEIYAAREQAQDRPAPEFD